MFFGDFPAAGVGGVHGRKLKYYLDHAKIPFEGDPLLREARRVVHVLARAALIEGKEIHLFTNASVRTLEPQARPPIQG